MVRPPSALHVPGGSAPNPIGSSLHDLSGGEYGRRAEPVPDALRAPGAGHGDVSRRGVGGGQRIVGDRAVGLGHQPASRWLHWNTATVRARHNLHGGVSRSMGGVSVLLSCIAGLSWWVSGRALAIE